MTTLALISMLVILNDGSAIEADSVTGVYIKGPRTFNIEPEPGSVMVEFIDRDGSPATIASKFSFLETVKKINQAKCQKCK